MSGFFTKIKAGATKATDFAQQQVEMTRIHSQISGKRKEIERIMTKIGEAVFQAYSAGDLSLAERDIALLAEAIEHLNCDISELELKIKELKNEKDCVCGKVVPFESKFCPNCGHHFSELPAAASSVQDSGHAVNKACSACGAPTDEDTKFCAECGTPQ